jgi:hypothetical protein
MPVSSIARRAVIAGVIATAATALAGATVVAGGSGAGPGRGYHWPVKPFDRAHPIRGTFGEPRTWFDGPPTPETLRSGTGSFSFHQGVDIVAPDGTPVYPVESGTARLLGGRTVAVQSGEGRSWQYWHIVPAVKTGEHVVADVTVLGRIRPGYGHVHFGELRHGRAVNPLAPGHLTPYVDATAPVVGPIELRRPDTGAEVMPELVRGRVELVVSARDDPMPPAPGLWRHMSTAPVLVAWRVERARDGRIVLAEHAAFDVRVHVPPNAAFWRYYVRGTRSNMPTFAQHRYWLEEGLFLYRLGVLDTTRLPDGIYVVVATAANVCGQRASTRRTFLVRNMPGLPPTTPQT